MLGNSKNEVYKPPNYIFGCDGLAAVYVKQPGTPDQAYYAHTDHLGSIVKLTDNNGTPVFQASYDAWGLQEITNSTFSFHRGYTGHEHLPEFGLINMNGRMYHPVLGRFLSPDPYVHAPEYSQNFNRYSYCLNNPLVYTDPSGEVWWVPLAVGAVMGGISGGMMANDMGATGFWEWASYIGGGSLIGGLSGLTSFGITSVGGGPVLSGMLSGMVSGAGFSGLATGWDSDAMLKGGIFGGISGLAGSSMASSIGGGIGAALGGVTSNLTNQLLYNGFQFDKVNWMSALLSGTVSYGMHHALTYASWKWGGGNNIGGEKISYRQFDAINTAYQRSRFWGREFGVYMNTDGSAKITPWKDTDKLSVNFSSRKGNIHKTAHIHWAKEGTEWVMNNGKYERYDPTKHPAGMSIEEAVGGYHSQEDFKRFAPYNSIVVGRTTSTYLPMTANSSKLIYPDPFIRFFLFFNLLSL